MIRVLHMLQAWSPKFGGVQSVVRAMSKAQSEAGLDVHVVTTNLDTPSGGILNVRVPTDEPMDWHGAKVRLFSAQNKALLYSSRMRTFLKRHCRDYDIIHIHGLYRFPMTYAAWQARKQGIPYIITPHGSLDPYLYKRSTRGNLLLKRIYERLFDLPNLNRASAIHYTAEEERNRAAFFKLKAPSVVVPIGLDWERFARLPARGRFRAKLGIGDASLVLFLGRLHSKKGLDILVDAFAKVKKAIPNARLAVVGPDNDGYASRVRGWIREKGLEESVTFVDALEGDAVIQAYVDADVFVLPSYTENFGMTVVEAMACGTPVVISDQVNIHREVAASGGGVVVRCDSGEVADQVIELLGDMERRNRMGLAGREYVKSNLAWPLVVKRMIREYERLITGQR